MARQDPRDELPSAERQNNYLDLQDSDLDLIAGGAPDDEYQIPVSRI